MTLKNNFCSNCGANLSKESKFCAECGVKVEKTDKMVDAEKIIVEKKNAVNPDVCVPVSNSVGGESPKTWDQYFKIKNRYLKRGLQFVFIPLIATIFFGLLAGLSGENGAVFFTILAGLSGIAQLVGLIIGIYFWTKKVEYPDEKYDERSGRRSESEVPKEILGFNYGAVGLAFVWGLFFRVFEIPIYIIVLNVAISLISLAITETTFVWLITFSMLYLMVLVGFGNGHANKLAWCNNRWPSVEKFLAVQKQWRIWGIAAFCLMIIVMVMNFGVVMMKSKLAEDIGEIEQKYGN